MNSNADFPKDPIKMKAVLTVHNDQMMNDVLQDPVWLSMVSTLGMYRSDQNFKEILCCFWTALCMLNGIEIGSTVYECLLDRLRNTYRDIGVKIDASIGKYLDFDFEDDD